MKRVLSIILAVALVVCAIPAMAFATDYIDISGHWGEDAIERWDAYGVVSGKGNRIFDPDGLMTRGEAAQVFANLLKLTAKGDLSGFTDVGLGKWYDDAVAKCVKAGIMSGDGNGSMNPESKITREEFFVMFANALGILPETTVNVAVADSAQAASWAAGYITALVNRGIIQGTVAADKGIVVEPKLNINRASIMALMDKSIKTYVNTIDKVTAGDGLTLIVVDNANVTFTNNTKDAEVYVFGNNAAITNAPVGTVVITSKDATGTKVNAKSINKETTIIVEKTTPSGGGGGSYTPPTPPAVPSTTVEVEEVTVKDTGEIQTGGGDIAITSGAENKPLELSKEKAVQLAEKINDMLDSTPVAQFTETKLDAATQINTTEGLQAIIGELQDKAGDDTAKNNIGSKTASDIDLQIKIVLSNVNINASDDLTVTSMEFEVTPIASTTVKNGDGDTITVSTEIKKNLSEKVKFRLPIDSNLNVTGNKIAVYHEGKFFGNYIIQGDAPNTYIEIESNNFSKFGYSVWNSNNAAAKIGDTLYFKFADAAESVKNGETITLLKTATGKITISREVSFTVEKNGKNFEATVQAATGYSIQQQDVSQTTFVFTCKEQFSVTSVNLDKVEIDLLPVGDTVTLTATVLPENATNKNVTWSSSNEDVATVENGKVTAIAAGFATITVTTVDGNKTAICTVTVVALPKYTVTFDMNGIDVSAPEQQTITSGEKVVKPASPTDSTGVHTFEGWYKTKDPITDVLSDKWNFDTDTVTADMTLYAQWTTVISKIVGTNLLSIPKSETFDYHTGYSKWEDVPQDAWVVDGTDDKKAFWVPTQGLDGFFMVIKVDDKSIDMMKFCCDDDDTFIKVGDKYVCSNKYGYGTFTCTMTEGKFTSLTFTGNDLSGVQSVAINFTLFNGTYAPEKYTVAFDMKGHGTQVASYTDVASGSKISAPTPEPTATDLTFGGWYKEAGCINAWNFATDTVKEDTTLYAKWIENNYIMKTGGAWFSTLVSGTSPMIQKASVTAISFVKELPTDVASRTDLIASNTDLTDGGPGKVKGYIVKNGDADTYDVYIVGEHIFGNADCSVMFWNFTNLTTLELGNFNTSNVTSMQGMFHTCSTLASLNLSNFDTSKVTTKESMFSGCSALTELTLSDFDTPKLTTTKNMFNSCKALARLNLSGFNTASVTNMVGMFESCTALTDIDLSSFNTANVTNMNSMFKSCTALTGINLSKFNTASVTNMNSMFYGCSALTELKLNSFDTANVTDMRNMFSGCSKLESLNLSNFDISKVTNMALMFDGCSALNSVTIPAKTGAKPNDTGHWYFGFGTEYISPPEGKNFTLAN